MKEKACKSPKKQKYVFPHLIFYISPLGAIMMLVPISIFIDKFDKTNIIVRFLANCGKNSFIILAFHQIICLVIQKFLSSKITISLLIIILAFFGVFDTPIYALANREKK